MPISSIRSLAAIFFVSTFCAQAQSDSKTLAPYFYISGDSDELDLLPVKSIEAYVQIAGVIADVKLSQTFVNSGAVPIEAVYVFPSSTKAAVNGLTMTIGERVIVAKIEERQEAQRKYNLARDGGFRASLLEQNRPNVFQMNVANIMPGDTIEVSLKYNELIESRNGIYEFVFPTVVGPRYSEKGVTTATQNDQWVSSPYLEEGSRPNYSLDLNVVLSSPVPIESVKSSWQGSNISYSSSKSCQISVSQDELESGAKDFILNYSLAGDDLQAGVLTNQNGDENFFALMIQPPKLVSEIEMPTREYTFVVDVSGSMSGFPLDAAKDLMNSLLKTMRERDRFNVVLFASNSKQLFKKPQQATADNIKQAIRMLNRNAGGGGTRLYKALKSVINDPCEGSYSRSIVVVTDGFIDAEKEVFDLIRDNAGSANVFAFGVGSSVNRYLIEGMAKAGKGAPFVIHNKNASKSKVKEFVSYIGSPALTNVRLDFGTNKVYHVSPRQIPDVFQNRPIVVYGKYYGKFDGQVTLTGNDGNGEISSTLFADTVSSQNAGALQYLWARKRIEVLNDRKFSNENKNEITQLGLGYSLMTTYTSFLAVDSDTLQNHLKPMTIKQPLPLPQGVGNGALGSHRSRLNATGAVSRSVAAGIELVHFGDLMEVINPLMALRWDSDDLTLEYDVVIKNINGEEIWSQSVKGTSVWVDLSLPEFSNDEIGLFILEISKDSERSTSVAIKKRDDGSAPLLDLEQTMSWQYYVEMALEYEDSQLLMDAMTAYEIGIYNYPDNEELLGYYQKFLLNNRGY